MRLLLVSILGALGCAEIADAEPWPAGSGSGGGAVGGMSAGASSGDAGAAGAGTGGVADPYASVVLSDMPLLYWRLGEARPPDALDAVGNHDGIYIGGVGLGAPGALAGDADTAATFDGRDDILGAGDVLDFPGRDPFSLEAWVKPAPPSHDSPQCLVVKQSVTADLTSGYSLAVRYMLYPSLYFGREAGTVADVVYLAPPPKPDVYTHVVGTFDGFTLILYVNGRQADTEVAMVELGDNDGPLQLAGAPTAHGCISFAGSIDEVAIYGKALPSIRVAAHYQAGMQLR